jgi:uncharacterized protein YjiK
MSFSYNFKHPNDTYTLDSELIEISGINLMEKNCLACVQDEKRDIYELKNKRISSHFNSGKGGDSEDVVIIDRKAYILDAKECAIYEYTNFKKSMKNPKKHNLKLNKDFDPEGMCHDKDNNCLLIACKGSPKKDSTIRKVFMFDLNYNKRKNKAYFSIDSKTLTGKTSHKTFNPSGIAIHPKTREIYLIGTKSLKMIVCLNKKGKKILNKKKLKKATYGQPEGITFSAEGNLFISSEAKNDKKARIFMFKEA